MIYLFLADGFEEVEALAPLDMLRRVGVEVLTVGIGGRVIKGAHNIAVTADLSESDVDFDQMDGIILPGGMPGTKNLEASPLVQSVVDFCYRQKRMMAAICAAPSILGKKGLLNGKSATCFPGFESFCEGATIESVAVVTHDHIITARGAGCALAFGSAIITYLMDERTAEKLLRDMQGNYEGHKRV